MGQGKVIGVVVHDLVDDHRVYLGSGTHARCSDFGLNELTDIRMVLVLLICLVVINIVLALGMGGSVCFGNLRVEFDFRLSTPERWGGSLEVGIRRGMGNFPRPHGGGCLEQRLTRPTQKPFRTRSRYHEGGIQTSRSAM